MTVALRTLGILMLVGFLPGLGYLAGGWLVAGQVVRELGIAIGLSSFVILAIFLIRQPWTRP